MRRSASRLLTVVLVCLGAVAWMAPSAVAANTIIVPGDTVQATRADDGTTTLKVSITNLGPSAVKPTLTPDDSCSSGTGDKTVPPSSQVSVTFVMVCEPGGQVRHATIESSTLTFSVAAEPSPKFGALWAFFWGFLPALGGVGLGYLTWRRHPGGNPPRAAQDARQRSSSAAAPEQPADGTWPPPTTLGSSLPGLANDWKFSDNWAANIGLGSALFTGVFSTSGAAEQVLGEDSSAQLAVLTVAAALSAALVGCGPLMLVIWKRRYSDRYGVAKEHTIVGVLAAATLVLTATFGLIITGASVIGSAPAICAAAAASLLLLVYAWKSVPQTLAEGSFEPQEEDDRAGFAPPRLPGHPGGSALI